MTLRPPSAVSPGFPRRLDLFDRFGAADDGSGLRRGYGVGKVVMAWEQIPSLDDPCLAFTPMER